MAGYLKEPVVLQWDMKTGSYGKIVQHIIEKKVCELDPIKIRYINPKDVDDFFVIGIDKCYSILCEANFECKN